jgi:hypothetical protein
VSKGTNSPVLPKWATIKDLDAFLKRAESGDESTLPELRELFKMPELVEIFGGNLAKFTQTQLVKTAAGKNLMYKEALLGNLEMMRSELAGPEPTPVEKLLSDRIVGCWLHLHDAELRYNQAKDFTLAQGEYHQRRIERLHRLYLSAIRMLAVVRRLALPVLRVNIAGKQSPPNQANADISPKPQESRPKDSRMDRAPESRANGVCPKAIEDRLALTPLGSDNG